MTALLSGFHAVARSAGPAVCWLMEHLCLHAAPSLRNLLAVRYLLSLFPTWILLKDLVVDMKPFWDSYRRVEPWLHTGGSGTPEKERRQLPEDVKKLDPYINCILCACCYGSCPVLGLEENYLGPARNSQTVSIYGGFQGPTGPEVFRESEHPTGGCGDVIQSSAVLTHVLKIFGLQIQLRHSGEN